MIPADLLGDRDRAAEMIGLDGGHLTIGLSGESPELASRAVLKILLGGAQHLTNHLIMMVLWSLIGGGQPQTSPGRHS